MVNLMSLSISENVLVCLKDMGVRNVNEMLEISFQENFYLFLHSRNFKRSIIVFYNLCIICSNNCYCSRKSEA